MYISFPQGNGQYYLQLSDLKEWFFNYNQDYKKYCSENNITNNSSLSSSFVKQGRFVYVSEQTCLFCEVFCAVGLHNISKLYQHCDISLRPIQRHKDMG